jgi:excisionase family DNA binding protein
MSVKKPKMLTTQEVAEWFGVNPMTIYRKAKKGELPAIKFGKQWLFPEDALEGWIRERSGRGTSGKRPSFEKMDNIVLVYLFGSAASGTTTPLSDVDIAYLDDESQSPFDFEVDLEDAVRELQPNASRIDLVRLNGAPIAVRYKAVSTGRLLYAKSEEARSDFEVDTITKYLDFDYMLSRYYEEVA